MYGHPKGGTIFHYVTKRDRVDLFKFLLKFEYKKDIDLPRPDGSTPLHLASKKGHSESAEILLKLGVDVDARVVKFLTGQAQLIKLGVENERYETIILDGDVEPIIGVENFDGKAQREDSLTPLHLAAYKGREDIVELLLRYGANVNARVTERHLGHTFSFSPLLIAFQRGHYKVADILLKSGADINTAYVFKGEKRSILHEALLMTDETLTNFILTHKPDVKDQFNQKAFLFALINYKDDYRNIFKIIGRHALPVSWENLGHQDHTELIFAAVHKSQVNIVDYLLRRITFGIDKLWKPPFFDSECTLMHMAAAFSNEEMIEFLLHHGAQVDFLDGDGQTPSFYAVITRNRGALKCLIENGANVSDYPELPFGAIFVEDPVILEILLLHGTRVDASFRIAKNAPFLPIKANDEAILSKHFVSLTNFDYGYLFRFLFISKGSRAIREDPLWRSDRGLKNSSITLFIDVPLLFYALSTNNNHIFKLLDEYGAFCSLNSVRIEKRSLTVAFNLVLNSYSGNFFPDFLDYAFPQFDLSHPFENLFDETSRWMRHQHANEYAKYLTKINSCGKCKVPNECISALWTEEEFSLQEYQKRCEEEIVMLKGLQIEDTGWTFYDLLVDNEDRIVRYAKNPKIASFLRGKIFTFAVRFPIFFPIIAHKIDRCCRRKDLIAEGIRLYSFFFEEFSIMPFEIKELIVDRIPTYDLQVLKTATLNRLKRCIY